MEVCCTALVPDSSFLLTQTLRSSNNDLVSGHLSLMGKTWIGCLALVPLSPDHCGHVGDELANGRAFSLLTSEINSKIIIIIITKVG